MRKLFLCAVSALPIFVSGCAGVSMPAMPSLWPFGDEKNLERSRVPVNSITYQCAAGKRFYLRYLDNGAAAWVILPEREFRLDKVSADAGTRYGNGKAVLTIIGDEASLSDGPTISYAGCKVLKPAAG